MPLSIFSEMSAVTFLSSIASFVSFVHWKVHSCRTHGPCPCTRAGNGWLYLGILHLICGKESAAYGMQIILKKVWSQWKPANQNCVSRWILLGTCLERSPGASSLRFTSRDAWFNVQSTDWLLLEGDLEGWNDAAANEICFSWLSLIFSALTVRENRISTENCCVCIDWTCDAAVQALCSKMSKALRRWNCLGGFLFFPCYSFFAWFPSHFFNLHALWNFFFSSIIYSRTWCHGNSSVLLVLCITRSFAARVETWTAAMPSTSFLVSVLATIAVSEGIRTVA